ncbi:hypothetical protein E4634_20915 [Mangrovimicrobium sediminis]|uniref:Uncharacterized protein n=1 Tax=Mangrovimicrobium sediminis TaxID=2562682 RepID=A0A4Z0LTN3_9GAMM|nr:hypothetical protein [Haliea sp. SAOS-164]TGD70641.1 hypothetical protein E4634_20915 [Haliea sp. SAOS-164]
MPYVSKDAREKLETSKYPESPGELNYMITRMVDEYLVSKGGLRYTNINEVIGALECVKLELYRRIAAPYEDKKKEETGDVYNILK